MILGILNAIIYGFIFYCFIFVIVVFVCGKNMSDSANGNSYKEGAKDYDERVMKVGQDIVLKIYVYFLKIYN